MAAKKKTKKRVVMPFDMTDLAPMLGTLMIAVGKFGQLAERFINAHETLAGNVERMAKVLEGPVLEEIKRGTDAAMQLSEAVQNLHRDAMKYTEYDINRTG